MAASRGMQALRILVVTNLWPSPGGYRGIFVQEQVDALRGLGHHVDVEVVAQARGKLDYLLALPRVRRRVRDGPYDIVHIHYGIAALAARFVGEVPRVLTLHGSDVDVGWQRRATRLGSGGLVARIYPAARLARAMGDPGGQVIPMGVDRELFTPIDRGEARSQLGLPGSDPVILFGGDPANPVKGYDIFADVLSALRRGGRSVHELVLTSGRPARSAVPLRFAAADVLLCTSRKGSESGPSVVKEAAAMNLPVVSVAVGDVAEVLAGVAPSAVVPFPEPWGSTESRQRLVEALASRTAEVLASGQRSNGRSGTQHLDNRVIATRIVDVYRRVLELPPTMIAAAVDE